MDTIKQKIDRTYYRIKDKCYNPKSTKFKNYGGRGIKVCDEWLKDKEAFYNWSIKNGVRLDLSIDRIDVNGNYEPNNCRWATEVQQQRNKIATIILTYKGDKKTLKEWCEEFNVEYPTVNNRYDLLKKHNIEITDDNFFALFQPKFFYAHFPLVDMLNQKRYRGRAETVRKKDNALKTIIKNKTQELSLTLKDVATYINVPYKYLISIINQHNYLTKDVYEKLISNYKFTDEEKSKMKSFITKRKIKSANSLQIELDKLKQKIFNLKWELKNPIIPKKIESISFIQEFQNGVNYCLEKIDEIFGDI